MRARSLGGQASEQAERERNACLCRENRMTRCEHEARKVVADVIVQGRVKLLPGPRLLAFDLASEIFCLALAQRSPAQQVDGAMPRP
jgi:hypothetical protein